jgi:histidinol-phosphate aminotransferase
MAVQPRVDLDTLPSYVAGRTVPGAIKLSSNEAPGGPLPSVAKAIAEAAAEANRYPDIAVTALANRLARKLDLPVEQIAVGCGSVSLCQQLVQAMCAPGEEVLFAWRSFETYPIVTQISSATMVKVPLDETLTHDLDAMLAAITPRTRLIFVCNPNNPTSTVVDPDTLARFVEAVPSHILIALDEAYVEYIRDGMVPDSFGLVRKHSNVVVLRTFSKAYGLAGLRIGYAVGDPDIITALGKVYVPFTATSISQAAAIASLDAADELLARTDAVVAERARVTATLRDAGYTLPPSQANFVWLPLPGRAQEFAADSANARVIVRPYGDDGVRVTVAAPHENDAFLTFAQSWIKERG